MGHRRFAKMKALIRSYVYLPNINKDVENLVKACRDLKKNGFTVKNWPDKIFTVDAAVNLRNNWYIAESASHVKGTFRRKHQA